MRTEDYLAEVEELLEDRSRWCQGAYARRADGLSCRPEEEDAVCWCLEGAVMARVPKGGRQVPVFVSLRRAAQAWQGQDENLTPMLQNFNDHHDHDAVLAVVRLAREREGSSNA